MKLPTKGVIGLDTVALIYFIEHHPRYEPIIAPLWQGARQGETQLVVSELAIAEALVLPLKKADVQAVRTYEALAGAVGFRVVPISWRVLRSASEIRAAHPGLRMPDAIHLATTIQEGVDWFVTNDKSLRSAAGEKVIVLDDLLDRPT